MIGHPGIYQVQSDKYTKRERFLINMNVMMNTTECGLLNILLGFPKSVVYIIGDYIMPPAAFISEPFQESFGLHLKPYFIDVEKNTSDLVAFMQSLDVLSDDTLITFFLAHHHWNSTNMQIFHEFASIVDLCMCREVGVYESHWTQDHILHVRHNAVLHPENF